MVSSVEAVGDFFFLEAKTKKEKENFTQTNITHDIRYLFQCVVLDKNKSKKHFGLI